jgi:single-strand DNA-binding protein
LSGRARKICISRCFFDRQEEQKMASLNRAMFIGRLVRDPEMRYTSSGLAVTSFTIAVDRRSKGPDGEKKADFFRCNAWRQLAEIVNEYAKKGMLVAVDGRIEINEYNANDGTRKQSVELVVDNFQMLDRRDDAPGGGQNNSSAEYDDEPDDRPARPAARPAASGGGDRGGRDADRDERPSRDAAPRAAAPRPAAARPEAGARPAKPAAKPAEPLYPADDFDDSDPFADE